MKIEKKPLDIDFIKEWMSKGLNPIVLSILNRRNISTNEKLLNFFYPLFENILSPFEFHNIIIAYNRLDKAIANNEKIIISGDKDVDGTTSTVILINFLKKYLSNIDWVVPISDDPYGIHPEKIKEWTKNDYSLCITVDCGITNTDEIAYLKENNIDTIIIDHHQPLSVLPDAVSIINPKCEKTISLTNIAACGVTFIFILGYLFYKSMYFNKIHTVIYKKNNDYFINSYKNLKTIKENQKITLQELNTIESDFVYFYSDQTTTINNDVSKNFNIKSLHPIYKIYKNPNLDFHTDNLKIKLSLNHFLFETIKDIAQIKKEYLYLVLLGTIADIMPLCDTNRILTFYGLYYLKKFKPENLSHLCSLINLDIKTLTSKDIAWSICPLLNAPGRMGTADKTVNFLLNEEINTEIANDIININEDRKKNGNKAYNLFLDKITDNKALYNNRLTFFYSNDIHKGITGITAAKLANHTNCPTFVAAKDGEYYSGSIRGETEFHFVDFLDKCSTILAQYGGHKNAAGFCFHENNLESFKYFLTNNASLFSQNSINDILSIDAEIPSKYLDHNLISILSKLEPFGPENPNPTLYTPELKISNYVKLGKEKQHLKLFFELFPSPFIGIYWNKADWFETYHKPDQRYDVTYQLEINKFRGQLAVQMMICDIQKSL